MADSSIYGTLFQFASTVKTNEAERTRHTEEAGVAN